MIVIAGSTIPESGKTMPCIDLIYIQFPHIQYLKRIVVSLAPQLACYESVVIRKDGSILAIYKNGITIYLINKNADVAQVGDLKFKELNITQGNLVLQNGGTSIGLFTRGGNNGVIIY